MSGDAVLISQHDCGRDVSNRIGNVRVLCDVCRVIACFSLLSSLPPEESGPKSLASKNYRHALAFQLVF